MDKQHIDTMRATLDHMDFCLTRAYRAMERRDRLAGYRELDTIEDYIGALRGSLDILETSGKIINRKCDDDS